MGIFGVDVSNHQTSFDFSGWDFAILKASEGSGFKDRMFHTHLGNARKVGCVVAAYHYVRTDPAEYQVGLIESVVPKDVPIILDVEDGSGSDPNSWRQLMNELRERGYSVPLIYLPRWYWNKIGQPDLSGFPPLWQSWYPDYVARPREEGIGKVPASAWAAMDDVSVAIMQFTSSPFDQNYFSGTREDLTNLFGGTGESDMTPEQDAILRDIHAALAAAYDKTGHNIGDLVADGHAALSSAFTEEPVVGSEVDATTPSNIGDKVREIREATKEILARLAAIETGGVSEERIAEIAVDAVDEKLGDK